MPIPSSPLHNPPNSSSITSPTPTSTNCTKLLVIGYFPPPVHGQSVLTDQIANMFAARVPVHRISLGQGLLGKLVGHLMAALAILKIDPLHQTIYATPPGQRGLWLFLVVVLAARLKGATWFLHHHSSRPITSNRLSSMTLLVRLGGKKLRHIFLGEAMRKGFHNTYPESTRGRLPEHDLILPNAFAYKPSPEPPPQRSGPPTLGHLSVLTYEKGVSHLLSLFAQLRSSIPELRLILAGPSSDPKLTQEINAASLKFGDSFEYRGPLYGAEKDSFFQKMDLFLLPSSLKDETDPLVILEAFQAGAEVMASNRGCIQERLRGDEFLLDLDICEDVKRVKGIIETIVENRAQSHITAWQHAQILHQSATLQFEKLFSEMTR